MARAARSEKVPANMQPVYDARVGLTDPFCREHLTDEYEVLCREMAAALARKRPSPLMGGKLPTWACGIVYALGQVNFLFDKSNTPHAAPADVCAAFGLRPTTGSNKAKEIRDLLKIRGPMDPGWTLPSQLDSNPLAWMTTVNGLLMDARHLPREIQEEAYRRGLIPYLPAG